MEKILLIEDNTEIRENMAEILQISGYEVLSADNGKTGLRLAMNSQPDLIICDIMMPVLDGYGVLHVLQKNSTLQNTPFIFLTSRSEWKEVRKGMEQGADDYITKPFDGTELLNSVERRLKKSAFSKNGFLLKPSVNGESYAMHDVGKYLEKLKENRTTNHYKRRQVIYGEGNLPTHMYFINKGKIKIFRKNEDGKELIVNVLDEGEFVGYVALLENTPYRECAEAIEDTELSMIPRTDFEELVMNQPAVMKNFVGMMAKRINESENRLLATAYNSLRKKVADTLVSLQKKCDLLPANHCIDLSRDDLASIAGVAKESLIRTLGDFRNEKLIALQDKQIHILNFQKLEAMYN